MVDLTNLILNSIFILQIIVRITELKEKMNKSMFSYSRKF
jgi:hypothetical protein